MRFDPGVILVPTLVCALMACDSVKSTQGTLPPAASATGSSSRLGAPPKETRSSPSAPSQFNAPRDARTPAYEITWSVAVVAGELKLDYQVKALEELYVSDRLWDDDAAQHRIPDPYGVYRFVQNGSLRLVFAQAPHPPNVMLGKTYQPLYSRVLAGETRRQTVRIKLPVDEYSSLARDVNAPTAVEEVSRVYFVLGVRLRSTIDRAPAPPPRESGESAGYVVYEPTEVILAMDVDKLPVKRRTGYMARFALPGEPTPK